jgi:hypothetical protein
MFYFSAVLCLRRSDKHGVVMLTKEWSRWQRSGHADEGVVMLTKEWSCWRRSHHTDEGVFTLFMQFCWKVRKKNILSRKMTKNVEKIFLFVQLSTLSMQESGLRTHIGSASSYFPKTGCWCIIQSLGVSHWGDEQVIKPTRKSLSVWKVLEWRHGS